MCWQQWLLQKFWTLWGQKSTSQNCKYKSSNTLALKDLKWEDRNWDADKIKLLFHLQDRHPETRLRYSGIIVSKVLFPYLIILWIQKGLWQSLVLGANSKMQEFRKLEEKDEQSDEDLG